MNRTSCGDGLSRFGYAGDRNIWSASRRNPKANTIRFQAAPRLLLFGVLLLVLLAFPPDSAAQRKSLRVSYPAPSTVYLPLWVANDAGLFRKNDVDVELVHVGSSPIAMAAR